MNSSSSINFESIKNFIKGHLLICILAIFNIALFFISISLGNSCDEISSQIDSIQLNAKHMENQINQLKNINNDLETLNQLEADITKKCLNFGKKTSIYKLLTKINQLLPNSESSLNVSTSSSYNLTLKQPITLDQNLQSFNGNYVLVDYTMTFKSNFKDTLDFIKSMNNFPYFISLKQMDIKLDIKSTAETRPLLNVSLVYSILGKIKMKEENNA